MKQKRLHFDPKSIKKAEITVVFSLLLFAIVFVGASFLTGTGNVWSAFETLSLKMWVMLLVLSCVNYIGRGMKWQIFSKRMQLNISFKRLFIYYFAGMAMTVTPGKIGTALRLWFLKKGHQIRYTKSVPLMVMDPITDLASLFIMTVASVAAVGGGHTMGLVLFGSILSVLLTLFAKPRLFLNLIKGVYRLCGQKKPRLFASLQKMVRHLTRLVTLKVLTGTVFFSIVGWMASVFAFYYILTQMGAEVTFWHAMFVFSFSTILGGATMAPGGLGGTEASIVLLLIALNVPSEIAVAATLVIRTITLWFGVFLGFVFIPFGLRSIKKER